jgi:hypothetical protein
MSNTHFHENRAEKHDPRTQAYSYGVNPQTGKLDLDWLPEFDKVGDGGLYTTVDDFVRWDQNFYTGAVGGREYITQLEERGRLSNGDTLNYAAGLKVDQYKRLKIVEHAGGFMAYRTEFLQFPEQRFSVICFCNLGTIDPVILARRIADIYLEPEFATRLERFAGRYRSDELGLELVVTVRHGDLYLARGTKPATRLDPVAADYGAKVKNAGDRFDYDSAWAHFTVTFRSEGDAPASSLTVESGRAKDMRFVAVRR